MFYHNIRRVVEIAKELERLESVLHAIDHREIDIHLERAGFNTKYIQEEDGWILDGAIKRLRCDMREVITDKINTLKAELEEL
jgi:hypothetical protein